MFLRWCSVSIFVFRERRVFKKTFKIKSESEGKKFRFRFISALDDSQRLEGTLLALEMTTLN